MVILDATTKTITAVLSGAAATTNPTVMASWADASSTALPGVSKNTNLNGTTPVIIVPAPAASHQSLVSNLTIYNKDTAAVTVTIKCTDSATVDVELFKVTLAVGDTFKNGNVYDANGNLKSTIAGAVLLIGDQTIAGVKTLSSQTISPNFASGYTTTATAAGTTTLTATSTRNQFFTGTTTQTVTLPVTSTLTTGHTFRFTNKSTGVVTVQSSGGNTVLAIQPSVHATITCILTSGTTAASWDYITELPLTSRPLCRVHRSANYNMAGLAGAYEVIALDTIDVEILNPDSSHPFLTGPGQFKPLIAGYYYCEATLEFQPVANWAAADYAQTSLKKNGTTIVATGPLETIRAVFGNNITVLAADVIYFNGTTDYLEIVGRVSTGIASVAIASGATASRFSAYLVAM